MIVFPANHDVTPIDQTQAGFEVPRVVPDFTTVLSHCSHVEPWDLELFLVPDSRPEYLAWLASRTDALQKKAEKKAWQKDHEQCWTNDHLEVFRQVAKMKGTVLKWPPEMAALPELSSLSPALCPRKRECAYFFGQYEDGGGETH